MEKGRGDVKTENYFSGFASVVFFLRGWGGVFNIRRRTSSGFKFGSSSLLGFLSVIGRPSAYLCGKSLTKNPCLLVRRFLWHYEGVCSGNGPEESPENPEEIIVDNILMALGVFAKKENQVPSIQLKDPSCHFQVGEDHQL